MVGQISTIPKGWKMTTLGEVAELSKSQWKPGDKEQKYIGLEHINQGELAINGFGYSSKLESNKFYFKTGDVLFGKLRPYFRKVWKAKFDGVCSTDIWVLKAKENNDQNFLFYFVANPIFINKSMGANTGTHMPRADWNFLENTEWNIPTLPEQRAIAAVLSSLDDKIELLHEQNKTLEATAQAIFKEWFAAPSDLSAKTLASAEALAKEGKLPKGWKVGKLGDVVKIFDSKRVPLSSAGRAKRKGTYPYYGATEIVDWINDYLFDGTYLLLAEDGSVMDKRGNVVLQYVTGKIWVNNHAHVLQGKDEFSTEMLYLFCKRLKASGITTGAVQPKINQENLLSVELVIPNKNVLIRLNQIIQPMFQKIISSNSQIQTLSKLRDTLLPKLMSGKTRANNFY